MIEIRNSLRERLESGGLALGATVMLSRTVEIARLMKTAGYDWLFIDLEHGAMPIETATQISIAAQDAGICPIVRVPFGEHSMATRVLDGGALGIALPHIETAMDAKSAVSMLKYPPNGQRSILALQPLTGFASVPVAELAPAVDSALFIAATLESQTAIANAEEIAAVPGIDALLVGFSDLCLDMGIPGQVGSAAAFEAASRTIAACRRHGKWAGMGGIVDDTLLARYVGMGMQILVVGSDLSFVLRHSTERASFLRGLQIGELPQSGARGR